MEGQALIICYLGSIHIFQAYILLILEYYQNWRCQVPNIFLFAYENLR